MGRGKEDRKEGGKKEEKRVGVEEGRNDIRK